MEPPPNAHLAHQHGIRTKPCQCRYVVDQCMRACAPPCPPASQPSHHPAPHALLPATTTATPRGPCYHTVLAWQRNSRCSRGRRCSHLCHGCCSSVLCRQHKATSKRCPPHPPSASSTPPGACQLEGMGPHTPGGMSAHYQLTLTYTPGKRQVMHSAGQATHLGGRPPSRPVLLRVAAAAGGGRGRLQLCGQPGGQRVAGCILWGP